MAKKKKMTRKQALNMLLAHFGGAEERSRWFEATKRAKDLKAGLTVSCSDRGVFYTLWVRSASKALAGGKIGGIDRPTVNAMCDALKLPRPRLDSECVQYIKTCRTAMDEAKALAKLLGPGWEPHIWTEVRRNPPFPYASYSVCGSSMEVRKYKGSYGFISHHTHVSHMPTAHNTEEGDDPVKLVRTCVQQMLENGKKIREQMDRARSELMACWEGLGNG